MRLQYTDFNVKGMEKFSACELTEIREKKKHVLNTGYGNNRELARFDLFKNIMKEQENVNKFFTKLYDFIESKD